MGKHSITGTAANIVAIPASMTVGDAPPIYIPLESVEGTTAALDHIEMAVQLAQGTLAHAAKYGDAHALLGVRQIFDALAAVLGALG